MTGWVYLLFFVWSILIMTRYVVNFLLNLFSNPPKKLELNWKDTIILGFGISYFLTYIITGIGQ
jgi:hypothetical protein